MSGPSRGPRVEPPSPFPPYTPGSGGATDARGASHPGASHPGASRPGASGAGETHAVPWAELAARTAELSVPHAAFYLLVVLSTTIASYGLLANSTAVVIGAMLVAPLMGPIFGIAFGLTVGDGPRLRVAVGAELTGVALAVALGFLIGLVPDRPDFASEVLARTRPTVYDAIVALASGAAGAFALTDRRVSAALPGVAIATAIVPPLATVGLCLAAGEADRAGGAFLLFLTNLLAIEFAAVIVFTVVGQRRGALGAEFRRGRFLGHFGVSLVALLGIGAFLTRALLVGIGEDREHRLVHDALDEEARAMQGAHLQALALDRAGDSLRVTATVLTPQEFAPAQVAALQATLRRTVAPTARLSVRSVLVRVYDADGAVVAAPDARGDAEPPGREAEELAAVRRALDRAFAGASGTAGAELVELRRDLPATAGAVTAGGAAAGEAMAGATAPAPDRFVAVVRTPVPVEPARVVALEAVVARAIGAPAQLTVRSVLTRDATRERFLDEAGAHGGP